MSHFRCLSVCSGSEGMEETSCPREISRNAKWSSGAEAPPEFCRIRTDDSTGLGARISSSRPSIRRFSSSSFLHCERSKKLSPWVVTSTRATSLMRKDTYMYRKAPAFCDGKQKGVKDSGLLLSDSEERTKFINRRISSEHRSYFLEWTRLTTSLPLSSKPCRKPAAFSLVMCSVTRFRALASRYRHRYDDRSGLRSRLKDLTRLPSTLSVPPSKVRISNVAFFLKAFATPSVRMEIT
mmetsp:Transcript_4886/g.17724  ORF Transcript_4886/g.17724 Transcript_4886/m.17724 type:complete len:238 (+) Transcript_4886:404-1117(+)